MFDDESPYFNSRCIPFNDSSVTITDRRNEFPNMTLSCSNGCEMGEINETTSYLSCHYNATASTTEAFAKFGKKLLNVISSINIDIVVCAKAIFENLPNSLLNLGFAQHTTVNIVIIIIGIVMNLVDVDLFTNPKKIDVVVYREVSNFDPDEMESSEYFLKNPNFVDKQEMANEDHIRNENENIQQVELDNNAPQISMSSNSPGAVGAGKSNNNTNSNNDEEAIEKIVLGINVNKTHQKEEEKSFYVSNKEIESSSGTTSRKRLVDYYTSIKAKSKANEAIKSDENVRVNDQQREVNKENNLAALTLIKDYEGLSIMEKLKYDPRNFINYYYDSLVEDHVILNLILKKSFFSPLNIRIVRAAGMTSMMFCFNAIFFSDDEIEKAKKLDDNDSSDIEKLAFSTSKSIISFAAAMFLVSFLDLIIKVPKELEEKASSLLKTKNKLLITCFYNIYLKKMKTRFTVFIIIYSLLNAFCMYYVILFNTIYEKSSVSWIKGAFLSLFYDWVCLEFGIPFLQACIRSLAIKIPFLRAIIYLTYFFFAISFFI